MALKVVVVSADPVQISSMDLDGIESVRTLSEEQTNIGVQIQEVLSAVTEAVRPTVVVESELTIEIVGSVTLQARGETSLLFLKVGGGASTSDTLKVSLKTRIAPDSR